MSPKEKANSLVNKFRPFAFSENGKWVSSTYNSKQCALIAVEEILKTNTDESIYGNQFSVYWDEVKKEIRSL
jgi:hypothetical protein